jgi:hypothetical protein
MRRRTGPSSILPSAELVCVDPTRVREIWPAAAPLLRQATARTGLSAFTEIEREVLAGSALLWIAVSGEGSGLTIDAAASTSLQQTDTGRVCVITACAGHEMSRWLPLIAGIENYARDEGCARVRILGRKGWLRVLDGYRAKYIILDKELADRGVFSQSIRI